MDIKIDKFRERLIEIMKNSNPDISESELNEGYRFYKYNELYDENEKNLISIVESRGVAYFQYSNVIEEIISYVKKRLNEGVVFIPSNTEQIQLKNGKLIKPSVYITRVAIPYEITSKIDFFECINIDINITKYVSDYQLEDIDEYAFIGTGHEYNDNHYINLTSDNKLEGENIVINGYMYNNNLFANRITEELYHELNHAYKNYIILYKSSIKDYMPIGTNKEVVNMINSDNMNLQAIGFILYRLWNKDEMNAAVESVYGCLSKRENLGLELQSVKAFQEYKTLKDAYIPSIIYISNDLLDTIANILNIEIKDYKTFRKWFMTKSNALNNTFFHKIIKAASLAYTDEHISNRK